MTLNRGDIVHETRKQMPQPIRIVGYSARVEKARASEQIGALWQQAAQSGLFERAQATYGAYYAYEDRFANAYRVLVGVESDAEPAEGQDVVEVPPGDFAVFEDEGAPIEMARQMWQHVWTKWGGTRQFAVDFERYEGGPDHAAVSLFIGVS